MQKDVSQNGLLESLADEVQQEHRLRLDTERLGPLVPRRFRRRPRPQTAIISHKATAKAVVSDWLKSRNVETV